MIKEKDMLCVTPLTTDGDPAGILYISDLWVVFDPVDDRLEFVQLRTKTWETFEAAISDIARIDFEYKNRG